MFKAKSSILDSVRINGNVNGPTSIRPLTYPFYPYPAGWANEEDFVDYSVPDKSYSVRFTPNDAQIYQLVIRIHFYDSINPSNINRYVDCCGNNLDLARDKRTGGLSSVYMQQDFKGKDVLMRQELALVKWELPIMFLVAGLIKLSISSILPVRIMPIIWSLLNPRLT